MIENNSEKLSQDFAASVVLGAGQFCTNPGIFFILNSNAADNFIAQLTTAITAKPVQPMLTKQIAQAYCNGIAQQRNVDNAAGLVAFDKNTPTPKAGPRTEQSTATNTGLTTIAHRPAVERNRRSRR